MDARALHLDQESDPGEDADQQVQRARCHHLWSDWNLLGKTPLHEVLIDQHD